MSLAAPRLPDLRSAAVPVELCAELRDMMPAAAQERLNVEVMDSKVLVKLWSHVQSHVPRNFKGLTLVGPHPCMRFLEYVASAESDGRDHPLHADTPLQDAGSCSCITVLVYLNSNFQGGELQFVEGEDHVTIAPQEGMVLIFPHRLLHRAKVVKEGTKQLLKLSVLYAEPQTNAEKGETTSCRDADMAERLPFVMAAKSVERNVASAEGKAQAGYFQKDALWKHTLSMVGTKKDELSALIRKVKEVATDDAREELLDFILQHDVSSEPWAEELLTSAFTSLAQSLQGKLKMKGYQALDSVKVLHGHELCVLLGETLMRDFEVGESQQIRLAAVRAVLTLMPQEYRSDVLLKALRDSDAEVRLAALQGLASQQRLEDGYAAALQAAVDAKASTEEVALALQALALVK